MYRWLMNACLVSCASRLVVFLSSFRCVMAGSFFQEATILESHGIDVQSPGGHSNSDDIDGNDYTEQVRERLYTFTPQYAIQRLSN